MDSLFREGYVHYAFMDDRLVTIIVSIYLQLLPKSFSLNERFVHFHVRNRDEMSLNDSHILVPVKI